MNREQEAQQLGKYILQQRLGHGGMGEVWKALDTQLQRHVAIKLMRADWQDNPEFVQRFTQEARLIATLHHPHIIQIHDFNILHQPGSPTVQTYMVMDYIQGQTLANYIHQTSRRGDIPPTEDIIYIFTGISLAIDYAHRRNMIHRDIKPANILLDQRPPIEKPLGRPILIDFGIARLHEVASKTVTGLVIGTPHYSAPEQVQSNALLQSDLYSLGIILYEIMTGVTPFRGETALAVFMQHLHDIPTPPMLINQQITPALSRVILKSIAKNPADRFQSACEMTIALCEAVNVAPPAQLLHKERSTSDGTSTHSVIPTLPALERTANASLPAALSGSPASPDSTAPESTGAAIQSPPLQPSAPLGAPGDSATATPPIAPQHRYRRMLLLAGLLIAILLSSVLASIPLFSRPVIGKASFSSSAQTTVYDQVTIDFTYIPDPQPGKVYYAWIESAGYEGAVPHWKLDVKNGTIHTQLGQPYPGESNLLREDWILVITEEKGDPKVSSPNIADRRYYILLTTDTPAYDFQECPSGGANQNICLQ